MSEVPLYQTRSTAARTVVILKDACQLSHNMPDLDCAETLHFEG